MADEQMTWIQWVQQIAAEIGVECDDDEADAILWSHTTFPFAGPEYCSPQVRAYLTAKKSGCLSEWCEQQDREFDEALSKARAYCWRANL